jgi:hypothetical protein
VNGVVAFCLIGAGVCAGILIKDAHDQAQAQRREISGRLAHLDVTLHRYDQLIREREGAASA